ncbi:surface lipoprotein assembly modifier [Polaromonas sp. LjRoot131]|uniref:surface lipoprotein assembly modifier n=1 Tax=Polaromonas sp. LjRoot131 TaxID=3342262 RepID=UPI003ECD355C
MYSKHKLFSGGAVLLLAGLLSGLAHAEVDALVTNARTLLDQSQAQKAFDLLEPQEAARAGDPDFDTVLGIAANETGQYTRAVFALERVLAVQPGNSRARAELGRALFSVGDTKASRQVLLETKQDNIPAEAAATIDQFLQAIDRTEEAARSSVKPFIEASIGYDTNINSGPGNPNVAVPAFGGLIFTLNSAGVETKDAFASLGGGLSARYVVDPRWSLIGNVYGNARVNAKYNDFNTGQVDLNFGASYRYDKHEFSGVVQAGTYTVAGSRARDQQGLVGEWTYRIDGFRQWSSYIQWGDLSYPGQSLRDATRTVIGTSYAHAFRDSNIVVFGGAYIGTEKERASGVPQLGHDLVGVRTGIQKTLSDTLALFGSLAYEDRKYGGADPLFLVTRHDQQWNLNLGLNWVPAKLWRVTPQLALTSVKSNVVISDYNRSLFSVTVRRDF